MDDSSRMVGRGKMMQINFDKKKPLSVQSMDMNWDRKVHNVEIHTYSISEITCTYSDLGYYCIKTYVAMLYLVVLRHCGINGNAEKT